MLNTSEAAQHLHKCIHSLLGSTKIWTCQNNSSAWAKGERGSRGLRVCIVDPAVISVQPSRRKCRAKKAQSFPIDMHWTSPQSCDWDASPNISLEIRSRVVRARQSGGSPGHLGSGFKYRERKNRWQNEEETDKTRQRGRHWLVCEPLMGCCGSVRACARLGARVLALQNDGGPGPGLMRCFRDNASRRVDMWFGRRLYAIFSPYF